MKTFLCVTLLLSIASQRNCLRAQTMPAPTLEWVQQYYEGTNIDGLEVASFTGLATDGAGNVYAAGYIVNIEEPRGQNIMLYKLAPDGTELWKRIYDGPAHYDDAAFGMVLDDENGVLYVTGFSDQRYQYGDPYPYGGQATTLKYDTAGQLLWVKNYAGPGRWDVGTQIALDEAGNLYVAGESRTDSLEELSSDYLLLKYAPDGTALWVQRYGRVGSDPRPINDRPSGLVIDPAGRIHVTGDSHDWDYKRVALTVTYDAEGNFVRSRQYPGLVGHGIGADAAGAVYLAVYRADTVYTIKYGPDGTEQWVRFFRSGYANPAITTDQQGEVYVACAFQSASGSAPSSLRLFKYNAAGDVLWSQPYTPPQGSIVPKVIVTTDAAGRAYVVAGQMVPVTSTDLALLSYEPDGTFRWATTYQNPTELEFSDASREVVQHVRADTSGALYLIGRSLYDPNSGPTWVARYSQGTPAPAEPQTFWLEDACAQIGERWSHVWGSSLASAGSFVVKRGGYGYQPSNDPADYVRFSLNVTATAPFYLYARVRSLGVNSNSFWVRIDEGDWVLWNGLTVAVTCGVHFHRPPLRWQQASIPSTSDTVNPTRNSTKCTSVLSRPCPAALGPLLLSVVPCRCGRSRRSQMGLKDHSSSIPIRHRTS
ncbi:hypothetical protein SAMN05421823_104487 [Catalinimonas alkaloidigena]|uniref:Beta-propeller repeat-containing protein n=1 Tax=Catalinimonas alkaloidigena TaxID=1075417 RepID=A0A1G9HPI2_9BACT|nr:hypothetical protein [Catalinimonas alkaloidigena]SDL14443.1 hypothetical protein SAMN05421823_104487 [Catalinimonas alkaloidigena]